MAYGSWRHHFFPPRTLLLVWHPLFENCLQTCCDISIYTGIHMSVCMYVCIFINKRNLKQVINLYTLEALICGQVTFLIKLYFLRLKTR